MTRNTTCWPDRMLPNVELSPIDTPEMVNLVTAWLSQGPCHWLEPGSRRRLTPAVFRRLLHRFDYEFRVFRLEQLGAPLGVVALTDINREFKTATAWGMLGDKAWTRQGLTTAALSKILTLGFTELGLCAINAWAVDESPSLHMLTRLHFRFIGRQRSCHYVNGQPHDRLRFDLLSTEHLIETRRESAMPSVSS